MKNVIINCNSEDEYNRVLEKLEKLGCVWASGHKPTEKRYYNMSDGYNFLNVIDNTITTGVYYTKKYETITADDFLGNKPIVIYRVGRTVVALDQNTEETGVAKCHPTDDFDFSVGAKLAFERLLSNRNTEVGKEKPEEPKKVVKFKIGDVVTVDLNATVGRKYGGLTLFKDMARYGKRLVIDSIEKTSYGEFYHCSNGYAYSEQMLKHYDDEITIGCTVEVTNVGGYYTTYAEWVDKNVDNPEDKVRYNYGVDPIKGFVGKVIAIAPHLSMHDRNLVYFKSGGACYLINANGVKKV